MKSHNFLGCQDDYEKNKDSWTADTTCCEEMYDYKCAQNAADVRPDWDKYENRNNLIIFVFVSNMIFFLISYLIHRVKARNVEGFDKEKEY